MSALDKLTHVIAELEGLHDAWKAATTAPIATFNPADVIRTYEDFVAELIDRYINGDLILATPAALAASPEVQALIGVVIEEAAKVCFGMVEYDAIVLGERVVNTRYLAPIEVAQAIRALTPADATAWLADRDAAQFKAGQEAAIKGAKEIDRLRLVAFSTNSEADRAAYHAALSTWFQNLILVGEGE